MQITSEDYHYFCDENAGYCFKCDEITCDSNIEPDSNEALCPKCGEFRVMGMEQALINQRLELKDDEED